MSPVPDGLMAPPADPEGLPVHLRGYTFLFNATGEDLAFTVDSIPHEIPSKEVIEISREYATIAMRHLVARGVVEINPRRPNLEEAERAGMAQAVASMKLTLEMFEKNNADSIRAQHGPLPLDDSVIRARALLPIYEEAHGVMERQAGIDKAAELARTVRANLAKTPKVELDDVSIDAMPLDRLRQLATDLDLNFDAKANSVTLRKLIKSEQAERAGGGFA